MLDTDHGNNKTSETRTIPTPWQVHCSWKRQLRRIKNQKHETKHCPSPPPPKSPYARTFYTFAQFTQTVTVLLSSPGLTSLPLSHTHSHTHYPINIYQASASEQDNHAAKQKCNSRVFLPGLKPDNTKFNPPSSFCCYCRLHRSYCRTQSHTCPLGAFKH